jgi:hypothetical protein
MHGDPPKIRIKAGQKNMNTQTSSSIARACRSFSSPLSPSLPYRYDNQMALALLTLEMLTGKNSHQEIAFFTAACVPAILPEEKHSPRLPPSSYRWPNMEPSSPAA